MEPDKISRDVDSNTKSVLDILEIISEKWFKWLSWVMISAALHAIGAKTDNILVKSVAWVSAVLLFLYAWLSLEHLADSYFPKPSQLPKVFVHLITMVIAAIPFAIVFFLSTVFQGISNK